MRLPKMALRTFENTGAGAVYAGRMRNRPHGGRKTGNYTGKWGWAAGKQPRAGRALLGEGQRLGLAVLLVKGEELVRVERHALLADLEVQVRAGGAAGAAHLRDVLALQDDHCALDGANLTVTEPVVHWPLDRLELPQCRLLILQPPVPLTDALRGAAATVARHRPFVLAGLLTPEEPKVWAEVLPKEDYVVRVFALREIDAQLRAVPQGKHSRTLILVAKPRNKTPNDRRS